MLWDDSVSGFGVRVRATGAKSYVVVYRAGAGRGAPVRRYTIAAVGKITPEAPGRAPRLSWGRWRTGTIRRTRRPLNGARLGGGVGGPVHGRPCASQTQGRNSGVLSRHSGPNREARAGHHEVRQADPAPGRQAAFLAAATPFQANRVLAVVGSMYAFAGRAGIVPEGTNPARGIDKFKESRRERFLTGEELERLGGAIREAETTGIPGRWTKPCPRQAPAEGQAIHQDRLVSGGGLRLFLSPAAACGKSSTCGGSTSISSAAVYSCPIARAAGRPSSSMPLPLRC